ncbi:thermonuclease family protein [Nitratireductor sp. OM-1]|uniref:thermonuclease family protein n=1 Tax=Nitratireductor sp. OM-1 TaxID=1756988 RepID=UPI001FE11A2E|nr:thermonuclease family protein [Nitratireductor sp. OM-1]
MRRSKTAVTILAVLQTAWPMTISAKASGPFALCGTGERYNCVVDGDTVWIDGEKLRLADIDAPETGGRCVNERIEAARAAGRLAELPVWGKRVIVRTGKDQYGHTQAVVLIDGESVGAKLIEEGHAHPSTGRRETWCK